MPLTPADVHNVAFSKPPIGKRGYNEDEVDAFLDMVEHELARLLEENGDLKKRLADADQQRNLSSASGAGSADSDAPRQDAAKDVAQENAPSGATSAAASSTPSVSAPVPASFGQNGAEKAPTQHGGPSATPAAGEIDPSDHHVRAAKILGLAQEMADRLTGEAKAESEQLVGGARTKSEQMLSDAKTRSEQMLSDAKTRSEQMVSDAKSKSEQMVNEARTKSEAMLSDAKTRSETMQRQAKEKADALQSESERKHTEMISTITEKRTGLEKHIEELSTFEREYRTRLKSYLEAQLNELGRHGGDVPADSTRRPADAGAAAGPRAEQGN